MYIFGRREFEKKESETKDDNKSKQKTEKKTEEKEECRIENFSKYAIISCDPGKSYIMYLTD